MKLIKQLFTGEPRTDVQALGAQDGGYGQNHAVDSVTKDYGSRPVVDGEKSLEDALCIEGADTTLLKKWTDELHAAEDEIVKHLPAWLLIGILTIVVIVEFETAILLWKNRGVTGMTRIVVSLATAITTVFLPWLLVEFGNRWQATTQQSSTPAARHPRPKESK